MKKNWFWGLSILAFSFLQLSCNKDNDIAPGYDMLFQRQFDIPAGISPFDVHHFQLKNIPTNWDDYLAEHNKTSDQISGVITAEASIGGVYGDADLSAIEKVSVRVYDETNPSDYLEIAYRDPAPFDSGNILKLVPSLANSKRFFTGARFSVDVVIYLRKNTEIINEVRLDLKMRATL